MVRLRLKRHGTKRRPFYRIVAIDSRKRRDGRVLEYLGYYDPLVRGKGKVDVVKERVLYWLDKGSLPSNTVKSILKREKIGLTSGT